MKGSWDDDRDPLWALRNGDPALFEDFVRTEARSFVGFFLRLGAQVHEAEDLVQELFLKLYDHAQNYEPRERFAAYTFRIARNAWIDKRRRRSSRPDELSLEGTGRAGEDGASEPLGRRLSAEDAPVGSDLEQREELARMRAALDKLPENHRMVFELGVLQELPYAEIAQSMQVPVGTIKSRMFHAVRKMRSLLSAVDGEAADGEAVDGEAVDGEAADGGVDSDSGDAEVLQ